MHTLLFVFGGLEAVLLLISILMFAWGMMRDWELEIFLPLGLAFYGTLTLTALFFISVVVHDHVHVSLG